MPWCKYHGLPNGTEEAVHTRIFPFFFVYLEFPNYDLDSHEYKSLDS